jgi:hypothetical protein
MANHQTDAHEVRPYIGFIVGSCLARDCFLRRPGRTHTRCVPISKASPRKKRHAPKGVALAGQLDSPQAALGSTAMSAAVTIAETGTAEALTMAGTTLAVGVTGGVAGLLRTPGTFTTLRAARYCA